MTREKFHTFDALRFFSFFVVFLSHLPYWLFPDYSFLKTRGAIGVSYFFVLSGFLITFLILQEKKIHGSFSFRKYMLRRILRIWPLYYLMLLFAFLTPAILSSIGMHGSSEGYEPNWLFSVLFLENYRVLLEHSFANVSPLPVIWSLCIEEHFYIVWGIILYFAAVKNIRYWIVLIILISILSRAYFYVNDWLFMDLLTNFDYFMYGAIPAYCYINHKEAVLRKIAAIPNFIKSGILAVTAVYVFTAGQFNFGAFFERLIEPIFFGLLFSSVLFILLPKENRFRISDSNVFSRLGLYTYGLYMLHTIVINLAIKLYEKSGWAFSESLLFGSVFAFSIAVTIIAAAACYHYFEKPFLKLKRY